jgi:hypothetical protein
MSAGQRNSGFKVDATLFGVIVLAGIVICAVRFSPVTGKIKTNAGNTDKIESQANGEVKISNVIAGFLPGILVSWNFTF